MPKKIYFPEWTAEQLALWEAKDQAQCEAWREAKERSFTGSGHGGRLKQDYPTRELFDDWLDKQCLAAKHKSLWKRTRRNFEAEEEERNKLTKEKARALLTKAIAASRVPANKDMLMRTMKEGEADHEGDSAEASMKKMIKIMPAIQTVLGDVLREYGFACTDLLSAIRQIRAFASEDQSIATDIGKMMKAMQGDLTDLFDG